jgi:hypothetical protein
MVDNRRDRKLVLYYTILISIFPPSILMCWTSGIPYHLFEHIHAVLVSTFVVKCITKIILFDYFHVFIRKTIEVTWLSHKSFQADVVMVFISILAFYVARKPKGVSPDDFSNIDDQTSEITEAPSQSGRPRAVIAPYAEAAIEKVKNDIQANAEQNILNQEENNVHQRMIIRRRFSNGDSPSPKPSKFTNIQNTFVLPFEKHDEDEMDQIYEQSSRVVVSPSQVEQYLTELRNYHSQGKNLKPMIHEIQTRVKKLPFKVVYGSFPSNFNYQSKLLTNHQLLSIRSDGNCFYRAISLILTNTEENHVIFRLYCLFEYYANSDYYNAILKKQKVDPMEIISTIVKTNAWAETITMLILSNYLNRRIYLLDGPNSACEYYQFVFRPRKVDFEPIVIQWANSYHDHFVAVLPVGREVQQFDVVDYLEASEKGLTF